MRPEGGSRKFRWLHAAVLALMGLVIWLLSAPPGHAQSTYEWREPDGTLTYGQTPPASATVATVRELHLPAEPPPRRAAALRVQVAAQPAASADGKALRLADARVSASLTRLNRAERALRTGQQPRPGERRHLVNGHSRLTQAYFDRIAGLEAAVTQAREEQQAAYAERDTLGSR